MIKFKINHHNIKLNEIKKNFLYNKKNLKEINNIILNLKSLNITKDKSDLKKIKKIANKFIKNKNTILFFGTGGSNLGGKALTNLLLGKNKINLIFYDNIDPIHFNNIISEINIKKTGFIIISKSGTTPETLSQFISIIEIYKINKDLDKFSKNCLVITENNDNPLRKIATKYKCVILDHEKDIGGRFSVFSNVGLLPAYIAGLNIEKIREGANYILSQTQKNLINDHFIGANIITFLNSKKNINLNILMTYSDSLFFFGKWYLQLWSESIGKKNKGITPLHSVGTTDQHSQLQLYLDGPKDKFFSLLTTDYRNKGIKMKENLLKEKNIKYLSKKTMGDLMYAEQQATLSSLIKRKLPVREIFCKQFDEYTIGQLMSFFMIETIASCLLIDVDPFNQPAVEYGKQLTKDFLSKK